jgi:hypothetical protein
VSGRAVQRIRTICKLILVTSTEFPVFLADRAIHTARPRVRWEILLLYEVVPGSCRRQDSRAGDTPAHQHAAGHPGIRSGVRGTPPSWCARTALSVLVAQVRTEQRECRDPALLGLLDLVVARGAAQIFLGEKHTITGVQLVPHDVSGFVIGRGRVVDGGGGFFDRLGRLRGEEGASVTVSRCLNRRLIYRAGADGRRQGKEEQPRDQHFLGETRKDERDSCRAAAHFRENSEIHLYKLLLSFGFSIWNKKVH